MYIREFYKNLLNGLVSTNYATQGVAYIVLYIITVSVDISKWLFFSSQANRNKDPSNIK